MAKKRAHWLRVTMKRETAAFFNDEGAFCPTAETSRLLSLIQKYVDKSGRDEDPGHIRLLDVNGNHVGDAEWQ